jgi:hypothetical protein
MMEVDDHGKLAEWDWDPGDPFFMVCEYCGKEQNMLDEINSERWAVSALYFCYECEEALHEIKYFVQLELKGIFKDYANWIKKTYPDKYENYFRMNFETKKQILEIFEEFLEWEKCCYDKPTPIKKRRE